MDEIALSICKYYIPLKLSASGWLKTNFQKVLRSKQDAFIIGKWVFYEY